MKKIHRGLLLTALIITALLCYLVGSETGALLFIILGAALEILFWVKLIPNKNK